MKRSVLTLVLAFAILITGTTALSQAKKAEKVKDPVCGMMVEKDPKLSHDYKGQTYYFCSKTDMEEFKKTPDKYVKK